MFLQGCLRWDIFKLVELNKADWSPACGQGSASVLISSVNLTQTAITLKEQTSVFHQTGLWTHLGGIFLINRGYGCGYCHLLASCTGKQAEQVMGSLRKLSSVPAFRFLPSFFALASLNIDYKMNSFPQKFVLISVLSPNIKQTRSTS